MVFACKRGHLAIAQWLAVRLDLDRSCAADSKRCSWSRAFAETCRNGHLDVARWLAEQVTFEDDAIMRALGDSSESGRLELLRWLAERFRLFDAATDLEDAFEALMLACRGGQLPVVQWLVRNHLPPRL